MPVSVVVGGQYGSEGKGKVALEIARRVQARAVVRVGGTNSGHTAIDDIGRYHALRQLPASVLAPGTIAVLPAGAIVDPAIFAEEVASLALDPSRVHLSPFATVITAADQVREAKTHLTERLGSTGSGTGAALARRVMRESGVLLAKDYPSLAPFIRDTTETLESVLAAEDWVVVEGTQGYGLSVLHGGHYPKATSRDTTAASFVAEAELSPFSVKDITLVIRTFPIRVAGDSGDLPGETTWEQIARQARLPEGYHELTTATHRIRRVGSFHAPLVIRAIRANRPTRIVLNHLDYVDEGVGDGRYSPKALSFITNVEAQIGYPIDWVGTGPASLIERSKFKTPDGSRRNARTNRSRA
jgi:adenylosuccinate synthase